MDYLDERFDLVEGKGDHMSTAAGSNGLWVSVSIILQQYLSSCHLPKNEVMSRP